MTPDLLSPTARTALALIDDCGSPDAAITLIDSLRPLVTAQQMERLAAVQRVAAETPVEPDRRAPAMRPTAAAMCPCESGRPWPECHGVEGAEL